MKKIKRCAGLILLAGFILVFSSCFDVVQAVSKEGDDYRFYFKLTISNAILAFTGENVDTIFGDIEFGDIEPGVSARKIVTEVDSGVELSAKISKNETDPDLLKLVPIEKVDSVIIYLPYANDISESVNETDSKMSGEAETIAKLMLSTAKLRFLISKDILQAAKRAYFKTIDDGIKEVPIFNYGNDFCVEVPMLLFTDDTISFDQLFIERNN